jgi:hypothetical protein
MATRHDLDLRVSKDGRQAYILILYCNILLHSSIYYNSYYHSLKCNYSSTYKFKTFLKLSWKDTQLSQLKKEDALTTTYVRIRGDI